MSWRQILVHWLRTILRAVPALFNSYVTKDPPPVDAPSFFPTTSLLPSIMSTTTWNGTAMTQTDMMEKDTVLVLDNADNVIGSASKRTSHEFLTNQPTGILHRAFSVFLFDESSGKLLLQKRASTKITFPNVCTDVM